jgi:alkylation response protein AidB-like acyl-CoA dehydrogenase
MTSILDSAGELTLTPALGEEVDEFMSTAVIPVPPADEGDLDRYIRGLRHFQADLHAAGLAVPSWPERFGGRGLDPIVAAAVAQRLGELGAPELVNFVGLEVLAPGLLRYVDDERLSRWLPPMASAGELWCQLFSEPDAGSDLASLRTTAQVDGDGWRITGQKIWSTWGQYSDWGLVLARTGSAEERHRGITAFVVDMHQDGVNAHPLRAMTGEAEFAEVFLDGVRVGRNGLVGEVGDGWAVTMHILAAERGPYAIHRASLLRKTVGEVLEAARRRCGSGKQSAEERDVITSAVIACRILDLHIGQVAARLAKGEMPGPESALTKLLLGTTEQRLLDAAATLLGPGAMAWGGERPEWVGAWLYSRAATIYGGSAQIQRNLIGERLLGLPR